MDDDRVGRYVLHEAIARGGMATVFVAQLVADEGVTRLVAVKRLHPHLAEDPDIIAMLREEARIGSRIHHPNVVPVLDAVQSPAGLMLVQEYVHGVPLGVLFKEAPAPIPIPIVAAVVIGMLAGLQAVHDAVDEQGQPLNIVHRDVSPQNVMITVDGNARLLDFGIAKWRGSGQHTDTGVLKGKLPYIAPERLRADRATYRADIYSVGVMLWELAVHRKIREGQSEADFVVQVASGNTMSLDRALSVNRLRREETSPLEPIIRRAMSPEPEDRYASASELAAAIAKAVPVATAAEVAEWVRIDGDHYLERSRRVIASAEDSCLHGASNVPTIPIPMKAPFLPPPQRSKLRWLAAGMFMLTAIATALTFGLTYGSSSEVAATLPQQEAAQPSTSSIVITPLQMPPPTLTPPSSAWNDRNHGPGSSQRVGSSRPRR